MHTIYEYKIDHLAGFSNTRLLWRRERGTKKWELCTDGNGCDIVISSPCVAGGE